MREVPEQEGLFPGKSLTGQERNPGFSLVRWLLQVFLSENLEAVILREDKFIYI